MRRLLNTLFVTTETAYLTLDGENIVVKDNGREIGRIPFVGLSDVISFSYMGASSALMGACAERNIGLAFCKPSGRFLARVSGNEKGKNVLLRRTQYRMADDLQKSCEIARCFIVGKLYNARCVIERTRRDHSLRIDDDKFRMASETLQGILPNVYMETDLEALRGWEGAAAKVYFNVFDDMILRDKEHFFFRERSRRPPLDNVNAMLSFAYMLLEHDCASALASIGLDAYVGFLHRDRPGRESLALDLMEELRPCFADRFVLTLINNQVLKASDFEQKESGAVFMADAARSTFLKQWRIRKQEKITHPFLKEKMPWGLVPYIQALLLARFLRGDLDGYPAFLYK